MTEWLSYAILPIWAFGLLWYVVYKEKGLDDE
jgi:hypothetical protein